jgi:ABC-type uncharacterized transport system substrate-binding protein
MVPTATTIGFLVDPTNPNSEPETADIRAAASMLGHKLLVATASTASEIDGAFSNFVEQRAGALVVAAEIFFLSRRDQLAALAVRHSLPAIYHLREMVVAGGLMSYGTSIGGAFRQAGVYTGRILNGAEPSELPVVRPTKFELVINLKTARGLGVNVPDGLLAIADEVIE